MLAKVKIEIGDASSLPLASVMSMRQTTLIDFDLVSSTFYMRRLR